MRTCRSCSSGGFPRSRFSELYSNEAISARQARSASSVSGRQRTTFFDKSVKDLTWTKRPRSQAHHCPKPLHPPALRAAGDPAAQPDPGSDGRIQMISGANATKQIQTPIVKPASILNIRTPPIRGLCPDMISGKFGDEALARYQIPGVPPRSIRSARGCLHILASRNGGFGRRFFKAASSPFLMNGAGKA